MDNPQEKRENAAEPEAAPCKEWQQTAPNGGIGADSPPKSTSGQRWCSACQQHVTPHLADPHRCPFCKKFVEANAAHASEPVSEAYQQEALHHIETDYQPATAPERAECRELAKTLARLKSVRPGTPEHQRLVATMTTLRSSLEAARDTRSEQPQRDLSTWTDQQLEDRAASLLDQIR